MEQGRKYEREGELKKAERFYRQELERLKGMRTRKTEQFLKRVIEKRKKAEKLYEEAKLLQIQENFEAARIKLHHVLDLWPGHPRASNRLTMIEEHIKIHHRSKDVIHVVKKGESLSVLSEYYYGTIKKYDTVSKVADFNGISPNSIRPGQRIIFPVIERKNGALLIPRQPDGEEGNGA
jgi:nucleoid-associated protein YgaU